MRKIKLSDLDILDVGNEIQIYGAIYSGKGKIFLVPLPDEDREDLSWIPTDLVGLERTLPEVAILDMDAAEMAAFLNQTDVLDTRGEGKAILRKSQRQVDAAISWRVFERDGYCCRYCGKGGLPLTVDHVDLWELGGATLEENLVSACRRCNKLRGNRSYGDWLGSADYLKVSRDLDFYKMRANHELLAQVPHLQTLRVQRRSR